MSASANARKLPGDFAPAEAIARMLRIDHAGEYGAKRIYAGQMAILKNASCAPELAHMAAQEEVHLATFNRLLPEHRVRPTALLPLWHVAGYVLGAGTALMGERAAMACTVAVESVITEHYDHQLAQPEIRGTPLEGTIRTFRDEELEHHDIALHKEAEKAPFYGMLSLSIRAACRLAIALSARV